MGSHATTVDSQEVQLPFAGEAIAVRVMMRSRSASLVLRLRLAR